MVTYCNVKRHSMKKKFHMKINQQFFVHLLLRLGQRNEFHFVCLQTQWIQVDFTTFNDPYNGNETHRVFQRGEIVNQVGDHKQIFIKTSSHWNIMSKLFKIENIIEICYKFIYLHQIMVSQAHGSIIGKALKLPF